MLKIFTIRVDVDSDHESTDIQFKIASDKDSSQAAVEIKKLILDYFKANGKKNDSAV